MSASITVCPTDVFLIAGQQWSSVAHSNKITGLGYALSNLFCILSYLFLFTFEIFFQLVKWHGANVDDFHCRNLVSQN